MINSLLPKAKLNSQFWDSEMHLDQNIRKKLLLIAQDYKDFLELETNNLIKKIELVDVQFTGSLAFFNFSKYSDVDLHLVFDFGEVSKEYKTVVKNFLQARKAIWNEKHNIKIHGYDVEVYPQDVLEPHIANGLYSITDDDWLNTPVHHEASISKEQILKQAKNIISLVDLIEITQLSEQDKVRVIQYTQSKIKKMRQAGLETDGEYSTENLVFKVLRRTDTLEKLADLKVKYVDKSLSVEHVDE